MRNKKLSIKNLDRLTFKKFKKIPTVAIGFYYDMKSYSLYYLENDYHVPVYELVLNSEDLDISYENRIVCTVPAQGKTGILPLLKFNIQGDKQTLDKEYFVKQLQTIGIVENTALVQRYEELLSISNRIEEIRCELWTNKEHRKHMGFDEFINRVDDTLFKVQSDLKSLVQDDLCLDMLKEDYEVPIELID